MKVSYKIFAAYILVSFLLFFLIMITFRFFAVQELKEMILRHETQRLGVVAQALAREYDPVHGWTAFENSPENLAKLVNAIFDSPSFLPPKPDPGKPDPGKPDPGKPDPETIGPGPGPSGAPGHRGPPPPFPPVQRPDQRIALFDTQKAYLAGPRLDPNRLLFQPIQVADRSVGWIGLLKIETIPHPLDEPGLKKKLTAFYVVCFFIFTLTGMVSYFLSRHLLAPIKELTAGTKELALFNFDTRIRARTRDEFGLLAQNFNAMADTLQTYETMRKQWLLDISHELRTPISILKAETEAMLDGVRDIQPHRIDSLHTEICHLETMVKDLDFLSREDARELVMEKKPVCPVAILHGVLGLFGRRLADVQISVINRLGSEPFMVRGDQGRLRQLFTNLLENNLRYTQKPGRLTIWQKREGGFLSLVIEDSGPGVPGECVDRLFDRLYRVDHSRSRTHGGTGLGLSICKAIVAAHNGRIIAMNLPEKGLQIQVQLPLMDRTDP